MKKILAALLIILVVSPVAATAANKRRHKKHVRAVRQLKPAEPEEELAIPCQVERRAVEGKQMLVLKLVDRTFGKSLALGSYHFPKEKEAVYPKLISRLASDFPKTSEVILQDNYVAVKGDYDPQAWPSNGDLFQQIVWLYDDSVEKAKPIKIMKFSDCTKEVCGDLKPAAAQVAKGGGTNESNH